ncbi:MAG: 2-C-methyl-D-erythritol 2,4-cyclodiphosphate synthase [Actinomycetota bacterium]
MVDGSVPRVGIGFDAHPWCEDRQLWLAGVRFDGEAGLAGHSDGDAVCHAIADAMLGAAGLGDLGQHFPDTDPAVEGISGVALLERTTALVGKAGLSFRSCDVTVICARPVIGPHREEMRATLARALGASVVAVSVKATRPEGIGLTGDGIGCMAVAVLT